MAKHRTHSIAFKHQVVQEFLAGDTLNGLARRVLPDHGAMHGARRLCQDRAMRCEGETILAGDARARTRRFERDFACARTTLLAYNIRGL